MVRLIINDKVTELQWTYKKFDELTTGELYAILSLRSRVFVLEQNCIYLDMDDKDQASCHLCGWSGNMLVAYARIIPPGHTYAESSIGRVVTDPKYRKYGFGKMLMKLAIDKTFSQFNVTEIKIGAQVYLLSFYTSLGFKPVSNEYLEDGIPHIEMLLSK